LTGKKTKKINELEEPTPKGIPFEDAVKRLLQAPPSPKTKKSQPNKSKDKD